MRRVVAEAATAAQGRGHAATTGTFVVHLFDRDDNEHGDTTQRAAVKERR